MILHDDTDILVCSYYIATIWLQHIYGLLTNTLGKHEGIKLAARPRVLDVGGGDGHMAQWWQGNPGNPRQPRNAMVYPISHYGNYKSLKMYCTNTILVIHCHMIKVH